MDLCKIENEFNRHYNLEKLKTYAKKSLLKDYLECKEVEDEFSECIPQETTLKSMDIVYSGTQVFFTGRHRNYPIFRIRYIVQYRNKDYFWYDLEFDYKGTVIDDYFDAF